jgi:hypothetical protein
MASVDRGVIVPTREPDASFRINDSPTGAYRCIEVWQSWRNDGIEAVVGRITGYTAEGARTFSLTGPVSVYGDIIWHDPDAAIAAIADAAAVSRQGSPTQEEE